jgi:hypothetical protein
LEQALNDLDQFKNLEPLVENENNNDGKRIVRL